MRIAESNFQWFFSLRFGKKVPDLSYGSGGSSERYTLRLSFNRGIDLYIFDRLKEKFTWVLKSKRTRNYCKKI